MYIFADGKKCRESSDCATETSSQSQTFALRASQAVANRVAKPSSFVVPDGTCQLSATPVVCRGTNAGQRGSSRPWRSGPSRASRPRGTAPAQLPVAGCVSHYPGLAFQIWSNSNSKFRKFDCKCPNLQVLSISKFPVHQMPASSKTI